MPSLTSAAAWPLGFPFFAVLVVGILYWRGGRQRVSARRGDLESRGRAAAFYGGLATVLVALDSPLDPLADQLFAAHMTQHVLLLTVAPALIVLAAPWSRIWHPLALDFRRTAARAIVRSPRLRPVRTAARFVARPLPAWLLFNVNLVVWHVPALYEATLRNQAWHDLEHGLFFFTALLFWAAVIESPPLRVHLRWLGRIAYITGAIVVGWVLAIVLALAPDPLYDAYASLPHRPGGLSALGDQQIAAGVMWVPGSIAYTIAFIIFFYRWLEPESEAGRTARRTRLGVAGVIEP
jgi:cytochrome c oxidase assembly factor CtaG